MLAVNATCRAAEDRERREVGAAALFDRSGIPLRDRDTNVTPRSGLSCCVTGLSSLSA